MRARGEVGPAQLAVLAGDLAAWADDFYAQRVRDADAGRPASDVLMMQADGKGIALRPGHRNSAVGQADTAHPGIKRMAGIVAVAAFTPPSASPRTSAPRRPAARHTPAPSHAACG